MLPVFVVVEEAIEDGAACAGVGLKRGIGSTLNLVDGDWVVSND